MKSWQACAKQHGAPGARGASESAVAYLRRALAEPPPAAERADMLLELGSAESLVSGAAAVEHLREAHELIVDPIRRAATALRLGHQLFLFRVDESIAVFTQALDELAGADPELERLLEAGLITNCLFVPAAYREARQRLERVRSRAGEATVAEKMLLALLAHHDARAGVPATEAVPLARRALAGGTLIKAELSGYMFLLPAVVLSMADLPEALTVYDDALAEAHRRGSILTFALTKAFRADAFFFRGDLAEAERDSREALAASETWATTARFSALLAASLADALIERGQARRGRSRTRPHRFEGTVPGHGAPAVSSREPGAPADAARRPRRRARGDTRYRSRLRGGRRAEPRHDRVALARGARAASARHAE